MTPILEKICRRRREDLIAAGAVFPYSLSIIGDPGTGRERAASTLKKIRDGFFFIGECKKGSPSAGVLLEDYDPVALAKSYEASGAGAISVLTEGPHFFGSLDDLKAVSSSVSLPALRKDFVIHPVQIDEAVEAGARMILLIAACLSDEELRDFGNYAQARGLLPLTEVHTAEERDRVLALGLPLIGINNRDLKTFKVDLNVSVELIKGIPDDMSVISESGIRSADDIALLKKAGFSGALVGTSLISSTDPATAVKSLLGGLK